MGLELMMPAFVATAEEKVVITPVTTGAATLVGAFGEGTLGALFVQVRRLASLNGAMYGAGWDNTAAENRLFLINPTTGRATSVGATNVTIMEGMTAHGGTLYLIGRDPENIYTINTTTGAATRVGAMNSLRSDPNTNVAPLGLASHKDKLYTILERDLYTINPTTGAATRVGSTGIHSSRRWRGLGSHNDILYAQASNQMYTINPATGAATLVNPRGLLGSTVSIVGDFASHNGILYMAAFSSSNPRGYALFTIA